MRTQLLIEGGMGGIPPMCPPGRVVARFVATTGFFASSAGFVPAFFIIGNVSSRPHISAVIREEMLMHDC